MVEWDKMVVLDTPIGVVGRKDRLVWPTDIMGWYTVKSRYHWVHNTNRRSQSLCPSSSSVVDWRVWKCYGIFWSLPKLRTSCGRLFRGTTTMKMNLFQRRCVCSRICPLCSEREESIEHVLLLYPWVDGVKFRGALGFRLIMIQYLHSTHVSNVFGMITKDQ